MHHRSLRCTNPRFVPFFSIYFFIFQKKILIYFYTSLSFLELLHQEFKELLLEKYIWQLMFLDAVFFFYEWDEINVE